MKKDSLLFSIAGIDISLHSSNEMTKAFLKDYLIDSASADIELSISKEQINTEKELTRKALEAKGEPMFDCPEDYWESITLCSQIAERIIDYSALLYHGSVVCVDDAAYMFSAKSGTGKSTHASLWQELLGDRVSVIDDDKPFLRSVDGKLYAYGTPWCGKRGLNINCRKELKAICFIEQSMTNQICEISFDAACDDFMRNCFMPQTPKGKIDSIKLLNQFGQQLKFYKMKCNMDISAAEMSYKYMRERI